jgi:hypothetical protein
VEEQQIEAAALRLEARLAMRVVANVGQNDEQEEP